MEKIANLGAFMESLSGKKTYITMAFGMVVVAANHFGLLPLDTGLLPGDWLSDEYKLLSGVVFRSALTATGPVVQKGPPAG